MPLSESAAGTLEFLARPWVPQVLYLLSLREARFSELRQALPAVSGRVLTERLRELCTEGLVQRVVEAGPPTRITYRLTEHGQGLAAALQRIVDWSATL